MNGEQWKIGDENTWKKEREASMLSPFNYVALFQEDTKGCLLQRRVLFLNVTDGKTPSQDKGQQ